MTPPFPDLKHPFLPLPLLGRVFQHVADGPGEEIRRVVLGFDIGEVDDSFLLYVSGVAELGVEVFRPRRDSPRRRMSDRRPVVCEYDGGPRSVLLDVL